MEAHRLGALAVVEVEQGIVLVHPPGGPPDAPASLPSGFVDEGETPEAGAVRLVRRVTGGALLANGPEGPAVVYPLDALPAIIPVRAANQRVLAAYLATA